MIANSACQRAVNSNINGQISMDKEVSPLYPWIWYVWIWIYGARLIYGSKWRFSLEIFERCSEAQNVLGTLVLVFICVLVLLFFPEIKAFRKLSVAWGSWIRPPGISIWSSHLESHLEIWHVLMHRFQYLWVLAFAGILGMEPMRMLRHNCNSKLVSTNTG